MLPCLLTATAATSLLLLLATAATTAVAAITVVTTATRAAAPALTTAHFLVVRCRRFSKTYSKLISKCLARKWPSPKWLHVP